MLCLRCQSENPPQAKFCLECGARLTLTCAKCRSELPAGAKFCPECGEPLAARAGAESRFPSPESYTPKHLAEKILTSKSALEGERKQVTVLFADLKGSMELLADRDPEEARKLLDPVLERMMEAVHRYEGTVTQVMGDGIMALFGAPLAHEDHAQRACYAALRMQESVRRYADEAFRSHGVAVQIRAGLNSGPVVVRTISSDLHMDYTAVGVTTHLAARMEQLAAPGSVLVTSETLRLAEGYVEVRGRGAIPVKGLAEPIEVYELTGASPVRSRLQASAARGLTKFVGRAEELHQLSQALERAKSGHGQVVAVVGEPGVGKSRLCWEFTHSHRMQGWTVVESSSVSYGKATAYLPVIDLLKAYFQIEARDTTLKIREKVASKLMSLDRALEPWAAAFLWLLEVPMQDPAWERLDPSQRRQRTLDGIKRLLLRESQLQPLLLVFEDLHWIDSETQVLLDGLVESLPTAHVLLLVSHRPEYQHGWSSKTYYRQVPIDPLPARSADQLLEALLGPDAGLHELRPLLIERTDGNPFFLEETVRTLVEAKVVVGERGSYCLAKPVGVIEVPATAQAVLAARIDRLPPEEKRLLQSAAVIGKDVPFTILQAIAEGAETELRGGLTHLQAAEFLYETKLFPDLEYTFKHALTHEVAYGGLLQERRRVLHAQIVETIETLYPDRLTEFVEQLAHHAPMGGLWEKAVTYLHQAGAKALARSAYREAVARFEEAVVALQHLPETRVTVAQAVDLRLNLRTALRPRGELQRVSGYLREAERLARTLEDPRRLGWVTIWMSQDSWVTGHSMEARAFGQSAHAIAERLEDVPLRVVANLHLGLACLTSGDYPRAEECFLTMVRLLEGELSRERFGTTGFPAVQARAWLAWSLAERGAFEEGIAYGQEGVSMGGAVDEPYSLIIACLGLAMLYGVKGELNHAIRLLERGRALAQEWNVTLLSPRVTGSLGYVYALSGRVAEGLSLLERALKAIESMAQGAFHSLLLVQLAETYLLTDRSEDARGLGRRALTLARERGQRGYEVRALRLLGEIASNPDSLDVEGAMNHYRQAMTLAQELGTRPLVAHCHLGLGKLYRRTGKRVESDEHFATATSMYREMGMTYWLEQVEKERA